MKIDAPQTASRIQNTLAIIGDRLLSVNMDREVRRNYIRALHWGAQALTALRVGDDATEQITHLGYYWSVAQTMEQLGGGI